MMMRRTLYVDDGRDGGGGANEFCLRPDRQVPREGRESREFNFI